MQARRFDGGDEHAGHDERRTVEGVRADIKVLPIAATPSRDVVAAWRSWDTMPIATRKFIDYMSSHIEG